MPQLHPDYAKRQMRQALENDAPEHLVDQAIALNDPMLLVHALHQMGGKYLFERPTELLVNLIEAPDFAEFSERAHLYPSNQPLTDELMESGNIFYATPQRPITADDYTDDKYYIYDLLIALGANPADDLSFPLKGTEHQLVVPAAFNALSTQRDFKTDGSVSSESIKIAMILATLDEKPDWTPSHALATLFANTLAKNKDEEEAQRHHQQTNICRMGLNVSASLEDDPQLAKSLSPAARKFWNRSPTEWAVALDAMPRPSDAARQFFADQQHVQSQNIRSLIMRMGPETGARKMTDQLLDKMRHTPRQE